MQTGFTLPGVTLPQGQDEVHASDGTTCRSAVSGSGAYLDVGVIRGNSNSQSNSDLATYGRVVVPIGRTPKRVDCGRLYELEVERLQLELKLLKMGLGADGQTGSVAAPNPATTSAAASTGWANEGWSISTILNLLDCYSVSAPAPIAFTSAPSGGDTDVTFATVFRLDGSGSDIPGSSPQRVTNGTHTIQVDLTATKSPGIFPAGNYQGTVTVRCE
ncbi:hypothetical protein [Mesorhizobium sp. AA23]|uniref:hypothetical protein n=1 Tax=Mesorhizobium sp. AA23 TaxID=1854058 RepID=UPI0012EA5775|nr:hypothetical protein [Mesorhizobium sp. AA23]